ncbi:MAG: hypothetical protein AAGI06_13930 [Pseudomonadota bacterium]
MNIEKTDEEEFKGRQAALNKVPASVLNHLRSHPDRRLMVVVVLDVPQPVISFSPEPQSDRLMPKVGLPDTQTYAEVKEKLTKALTELGVEPINWLDNSQSFVAKLSASELDAISENPLIAEIVPNENLVK